MHGMDDDRDAGFRGGESAQNAGLAAVSMDDLRCLGAEQCGESPEGQPICPGVDGSDQFRDDGEALRTLVKKGFERAFGAVGWARHQGDIPSRFLTQTENRRQGIFLGAPHDKARDNVCDPHPEPGRSART